MFGVAVFGRRGTDPAAGFLHRVTEKHALSETVFLIDSYVYLTAFSWLGLHGQIDIVERSLIEKWFHTLKMRADYFYNLGRSVGQLSDANLNYSCTIKVHNDRTSHSTYKFYEWC